MQHSFPCHTPKLPEARIIDDSDSSDDDAFCQDTRRMIIKEANSIADLRSQLTHLKSDLKISDLRISVENSNHAISEIIESLSSMKKAMDVLQTTVNRIEDDLLKLSTKEHIPATKTVAARRASVMPKQSATLNLVR